MSRVTELAQQEADEVEAAEQEEEEPEQDEEQAPEPEPEAEAKAITEKDLKALGREVEKYANGLRRVMGDDFDALHECPTCTEQVPGYVFALPDPIDQFKTSDRYRACPDCDGYGQVRSGAKNVNALVNCPRCFGNGWEEVPQLVAVTTPGIGASTVPPGYLAPSSEAMPTQDQWGRSIGHPHFGIPPASIGA